MQLLVSGGIVDESHKIYPHFGGRFYSQSLKWVFPSGATLQFAAIGADRDLPGWQGSQLTNVLVDEAAEWTEKQILFLLTRMRSATFKGKLQMVLSMNPDNASWAFKWWEPLLDEETGVPREGIENIVRWFVVIDDVVQFANTPEELYNKYGKGKTLGKDFLPKSVRIIPLSIYDNKPLLRNNPEYLANLLQQSRANQLKYLMGSWTSIADSGCYWKRDWAEANMIQPEEVPLDCTWVRGYDFGGGAPSTSLPNPDYTVGVKIGKSRSTQLYYVVDVVRYRENLPTIMDNVTNTAYADGLDECRVVIPRDTASSGKFAHQFMVRGFAERGVGVGTDVTSGHSSKLSKFLPFCSLSETGNVKFVRAAWNDEYFNELAQFTGGERNKKDDCVDATSTAFKDLVRRCTVPTFTFDNSSFTKASPLAT